VAARRRGFDADVARLTGQFHSIRSGEAVLELTYQFQLTGWWRLQPDFQYIFNPASVLPVTISPGTGELKLGAPEPYKR
jgi:carbohydrate-selective porin OprB